MADVRAAAAAATFLLCLGVCLGISPPGCKPSTTRSFVVDFNTHTFMKDGCSFNYVSGSFHYSRVPRAYWRDRLQKMAAAGLDAVQTYIPWNVHEQTSGVYDFSGEQDLAYFLQVAQQEGLSVILRAGPYICGEWDFGGFPGWILQKNGSIVVRTMDPGYIAYVDRWFSVLLPKLKPLLYSEGGPVIMVQVENEYGSYFACDHVYIDHLQKLFRSYLGEDIVLFTTDGDGAGYLKCGTHPKLFTTVDFGAGGNASAAFDVLRKFQPNGPLVNSEFYTGWLDYWGHPHAHGSTETIVASLKQMLDLKASVNMYMFEGGTNFGYTNGADPPFNICPTSYDYDGPLTEAGDVTDKYKAIRSLIMKYKKVTQPIPNNTTKAAYGRVDMKRLGGILEMVDDFQVAPTKSVYPKTMEQLGQNSGFMLYSTVLTRDYPGDTLNGAAVRDRAHVFIDGILRGLIDRNVQTSLTLTAAIGQTLVLLVENQGHINFGSQINNGSKGLNGNVTLGSDLLTNWSMQSLNLTALTEKQPSVPLKFRKMRKDGMQGVLGPALFTGSFRLPQTQKAPADTFLNMTGWFKGQALINGFNLGRYWPVRGPQVTLYVPASILQPYPAYNEILLFELDHSPCGVTSPSDIIKLYSDILKRPLDEACFVSLENSQMINGPYKPFKATQAADGLEAGYRDWKRGRGARPT